MPRKVIYWQHCINIWNKATDFSQLTNNELGSGTWWISVGYTVILTIEEFIKTNSLIDMQLNLVTALSKQISSPS